MIEGVFRIHEKGYDARWHNTELKFQQGETIAEAIATGHFENEAALLRAAYGQRNIRASGDVKELAKTASSTKADLEAVLQNYQVKAERQTSNREQTPEQKLAAKQKRETRAAQADKQAALEAAAAADPEVAKLLAKLQARIGGGA